MDKFFRLFEATNVSDLNKQIECYAQENCFKEVRRSDPAVAHRDGVDYICVTSTFETDPESVRLANEKHLMDFIERVKAKKAKEAQNN